ncbi:hypothetical protein NECAME_13818 [Necator americanus]|uniref:Uncharacterized protein n=1 Tax=Necator americanus TaxID=51031 RepID=W2SSH9_NECAM|nr:hypothetical protein NECAME_13818 [Necator americanus]ETN72590.1 hypothetical protein NECAME_13818 [Necator americanus]
MLALCRMLNDAGQKIRIVQQALVMLKDAISSIEQEENSLFLNIMRICMMRVGLRPLFERLSQSFESEDIMTCLSGITVVLDKVAGDKAAVLQKILGFSPSEHPLTSIISHVNSKDGNDETVKCVQQILDKFFQSLNDGSLGEDSVEWEDLTAPMVYGKITDVVKLYSKPLVQVLDSVQKVHEKTRAVSRILVHQKSTPGTRMGSEVAKVIEDSKGKEKAVLKILKSKMDLVLFLRISEYSVSVNRFYWSSVITLLILNDFYYVGTTILKIHAKNRVSREQDECIPQAMIKDRVVVLPTNDGLEEFRYFSVRLF